MGHGRMGGSKLITKLNCAMFFLFKRTGVLKGLVRYTAQVIGVAASLISRNGFVFLQYATYESRVHTFDDIAARNRQVS